MAFLFRSPHETAPRAHRSRHAGLSVRQETTLPCGLEWESDPEDHLVSAIEGLTAVELVDLYRRKVLSPSEAVDDIIAHIDRREPALNALYLFDPDAAREQAAAASTRRWAAGRTRRSTRRRAGHDQGEYRHEGRSVPLGTAATELTPSPHDAPPSARLSEAGAVLLGKTTMPDYGMLSSGLSSFHPLTRNPWDLALNPGGSSAGAAAAAAAGYGPLHLGTDIGGSVRLPAGWCGLVGAQAQPWARADRPALSRPRRGPDDAHRGRRRADDVGPVAARFARCDKPAPAGAADWMDLDPSIPQACGSACMLDIGAGLPLDPEVEAGRRVPPRAVRGGGRDRRAVRGRSDARDARRPGRFLARAGLGRCLAAPAGAARQDPALYPGLGRIRRRTLRARGHAGGYNRTIEMRKAAARLFARSRLCALAHRRRSPPSRPNGPRRSTIRERPSSISAIPWSGTWPRTPPSRSIPATPQVGLPIGLQIVGRRFDDLGVLRMAKAYEDRRPAQRPWPISNPA